MTFERFFVELRCPCPHEHERDASAQTVWMTCSDPEWLLRCAFALHLCDARTFVRLAYDFAAHGSAQDDLVALNPIKRWLDGESVDLRHAEAQATGAVKNALWTAVDAAEGLRPFYAATATARSAIARASARATHEAKNRKKAQTKGKKALESEFTWQCNRIRKLIPVVDLPEVLERAVAAKRLREAA